MRDTNKKLNKLGNWELHSFLLVCWKAEDSQATEEQFCHKLCVFYNLQKSIWPMQFVLKNSIVSCWIVSDSISVSCRLELEILVLSCQNQKKPLKRCRALNKLRIEKLFVKVHLRYIQFFFRLANHLRWLICNNEIPGDVFESNNLMLKKMANFWHLS